MRRRELIHAFILKRTGESELRYDEDIFETGLVNSMFVMELVLFVEQEFRITIGGDDLDFKHFRTVDALDSLVARKLTAG